MKYIVCKVEGKTFTGKEVIADDILSVVTQELCGIYASQLGLVVNLSGKGCTFAAKAENTKVYGMVSEMPNLEPPTIDPDKQKLFAVIVKEGFEYDKEMAIFSVKMVVAKSLNDVFELIAHEYPRCDIVFNTVSDTGAFATTQGCNSPKYYSGKKIFLISEMERKGK